MELLRELEPERYWSFPSSYSKERREEEISRMIEFGKYSYQLKTDGNWASFIVDFDKDKSVITRGISKKTGEYGRVEEHLFFFDALAAAFDKPTRLIGEIYLDGGIDKNVGSILRSKPHKAKSIQDTEYYQQISKEVKFTAKDKRDIEQNEFAGKKLKFRIFDCWYYDGIDLMNTPWIERQKYVQEASKKINHPLISAVAYKPMTETFYDELESILQAGGEGVVCYSNDGKPEPGKRTAHKTCKVKRELSAEIDCFITGIEPAVKNYTGTHLDAWMFWYNEKTGEKLYGDYYLSYVKGETCLIPISKGFYYGWPGAVHCGVYDENHNIYEICKVSGLEENFKEELKNNLNDWIMCPLTISGMMLSQNANDTGISVRHPIIKSIRKGDINPEDCTLEKIIS